jgi:hypothetical protein
MTPEKEKEKEKEPETSNLDESTSSKKPPPPIGNKFGISLNFAPKQTRPQPMPMGYMVTKWMDGGNINGLANAAEWHDLKGRCPS